MTALEEYQRLESPALWRTDADAQRREVVVSIGDATLTISDPADRVLTHWSLAAVQRVNGEVMPALYRPGADAAESLEIEDKTMVNAIEMVRTAVDRRRPHPGRLRFVLLSGGLAAVVALAVFWLPDALVRNAVGVVPPAQRAEIGERLLGEIHRVSGAPCATPLGTRALDLLHQRLRGPDAPGRLLILRDGVRQAAHLPGGIVLLNRALVEDYEDPDVVAGYTLIEDARADLHDPLDRLMRDAGSLTAFRLLTTGDIGDEVLAGHAKRVLTEPAAEVADETVLERFANAGVPAAPYAYARDISGESTLGLIEADPGRPEDAPPILSDGAWVSLQGICGG